MSELSDVQFKDIGELFDGPHATPKRIDEGPYFLNISSLASGRLDLSQSDHVSEEDFKKWTRRVTPQVDDLLFSYETRLGEAALMPAGISACLGRRMALLRPDREKVVPRYLLYYFLSPQFQALIQQRQIQGATVPRIGLATMGDWPVSIPSLDSQYAIAEVLGALDDKIAANERLSSGVQKLLQEHFVALGLDSFSGQGSSVMIQELFEMNPRASRKIVGQVPYLEMKNLPDSAMTVSSWSTREAKGGARFVNGDVLLARITPCLENGKVGYVDFLDHEEIGIGSTEFIVFRAKDPLLSAVPFFLSKSERFRDFAIRHMQGTSGRQRLAAADVAEYQLAKVDDESLKRFGELSTTLLERVKTAVSESRYLSHTRDELLPLLMSGKITVKDAEKVVSDAV